MRHYYVAGTFRCRAYTPISENQRYVWDQEATSPLLPRHHRLSIGPNPPSLRATNNFLLKWMMYSTVMDIQTDVISSNASRKGRDGIIYCDTFGNCEL